MTSIAPTHRVSFSIGDEHAAKGVVDALTEAFFEGQAAIAAFEQLLERFPGDPAIQSRIEELRKRR